eukprot:scaffold589_cov135-Skeletonema_marinoi.AAC.4
MGVIELTTFRRALSQKIIPPPRQHCISVPDPEFLAGVESTKSKYHDTAIRRPTQKSGREFQNLSSVDSKIGLTREQGKKLQLHYRKIQQRVLYVCGVSVA